MLVSALVPVGSWAAGVGADLPSGGPRSMGIECSFHTDFRT